MEKIICLIFLLLFSIHGLAHKDTIRNNDGSYCIGKWSEVSGKKGVWRIYNIDGVIIEKSRYRFSTRHGKCKIYEGNNKTKQHYYYGIPENDRIVNGKKVLVYFVVGWGSGCCYKCNEYSCTTIHLGESPIPRGLMRKVKNHNFFIDIRQKLRFGLKWKTSMCKNE